MKENRLKGRTDKLHLQDRINPTKERAPCQPMPASAHRGEIITRSEFPSLLHTNRHHDPSYREREKLDLQRTASKELCFHLIKKTGLNSRLLATGCDDALLYAQARLTSKMTSQGAQAGMWGLASLLLHIVKQSESF